MSSNSFQTVRYVVAFKEEARQPQQTKEFSISEAAYAYAMVIENEGGIAVVTPILVDSTTQKLNQGIR